MKWIRSAAAYCAPTARYFYEAAPKMSDAFFASLRAPLALAGCSLLAGCVSQAARQPGSQATRQPASSTQPVAEVQMHTFSELH